MKLQGDKGMGVKELANQFWTDILKRDEGDRFIQGQDGKWRPSREYAIVLRHSKILLKQDGLNEGAVIRTLLAMQAIGKDVKAMTMIRWEYKPSAGVSYYTLITGGTVPPACYDTFSQLLAQ